MLEELLTQRHDRMPPDVAVAIRHYATLIRRHILKDTDLAVKARALYQRHKLAFDFIFENMPDEIAGLHDRLRATVAATSSIIPGPVQRNYTHFTPSSWQSIKELNTGTGWAGSTNLVSILFDTGGDCVRLVVLIGPGPSEYRQKLHDCLAKDNAGLSNGKSQPSPQWHRIYSDTWVKKEDFDLSDPDRMFEQTQAKWQVFVQNQLPIIEKAVAECFAAPSDV